MENKDKGLLENDVYVEDLREWLQPREYKPFKVEDLYESTRPDFWWLLDVLLEDRVDLHDRIKRYKKEHGE